MGGISARPAVSTDEITSLLAPQKEGENGRTWPTAMDDALTANVRFRGIADMKRFSMPNDR